MKKIILLIIVVMALYSCGVPKYGCGTQIAHKKIKNL